MRERMYVGGLNPEVTGELLAEVFSKFGLVKHAIVITGKNYGFVTFSTSASVEQLLEMKEPLEVAGSTVILRQARRQLRKEDDWSWSNTGGTLRRRSWDTRWRDQAWWVTQSEMGGLTRARNSGRDQMFENSSAAGWVGGESWEAEWMPLPSQSPQYWDFPFCQTQPEEMMMMVSLQPNFPGQLPLIAPDGQLVYPVDSFPARLGTPESCSYLGSVDLPLGEVGGGAGENEEKQGWGQANWNQNNRTQEAGSRSKDRETWSKKEWRGGNGKEAEISRREPRTFGKWVAACKRENKVPKKRKSGKSKVKTTEDVKKPASPRSCEVQVVTKAREGDDVQIEGFAALQGDDTPTMENRCGENENIDLLADSLRPLKLDWNELE